MNSAAKAFFDEVCACIEVLGQLPEPLRRKPAFMLTLAATAIAVQHRNSTLSLREVMDAVELTVRGVQKFLESLDAHEREGR